MYVRRMSNTRDDCSISEPPQGSVFFFLTVEHRDSHYIANLDVMVKEGSMCDKFVYLGTLSCV